MIFQSTFPSRGTTYMIGARSVGTGISIHVPLAGNDEASALTVSSDFSFQSTFPSRGTTAYGTNSDNDNGISIHVPLAGNDLASGGSFCHLQFQSTFPSRGTTCLPFLQHTFCINFNPRSPRGERRQSGFKDEYRVAISIHVPLAGNDALRLKGYWYERNFNPRSPRGERLPRQKQPARS